MQGDDSATYDYGRTYTVAFAHVVVTPAVGYDAAEKEGVSPVDIPLLDWDNTLLQPSSSGLGGCSAHMI
jgi:hypothetical protein